MQLSLEHFQILNYVIIAIVGVLSAGFGVGVSVTLFRTQIMGMKREVTEMKEHLQEDILEMKRDIVKIYTRQQKLRGEDNGMIPVFMTRLDCGEHIRRCSVQMDENLKVHSKEIKALNNFARWFMQDRGLTLREANEILEGY